LSPARRRRGHAAAAHLELRARMEARGGELVPPAVRRSIARARPRGLVRDPPARGPRRPEGLRALLSQRLPPHALRERAHPSGRAAAARAHDEARPRRAPPPRAGRGAAAKGPRARARRERAPRPDPLREGAERLGGRWSGVDAHAARRALRRAGPRDGARPDSRTLPPQGLPRGHRARAGRDDGGRGPGRARARTLVAALTADERVLAPIRKPRWVERRRRGAPAFVP